MPRPWHPWPRQPYDIPWVCANSAGWGASDEFREPYVWSYCSKWASDVHASQTRSSAAAHLFVAMWLLLKKTLKVRPINQHGLALSNLCWKCKVKHTPAYKILPTFLQISNSHPMLSERPSFIVFDSAMWALNIIGQQPTLSHHVHKLLSKAGYIILD